MIGALRHRIRFQRPVRTPDGGGGFSEIWQDLLLSPEVYASIMPLSGTEQLRFHQLESSATHRITVRYRDDIQSSMRILHDAAVYDVSAVTDRDGLGIWLDILATLKNT